MEQIYKQKQRHFTTSRVNINDEFYTKYQDVKKELSTYNFEGKTIHCPADTKKSNFYKYFKNNFDKLKLKKLIITHIDSNLKIEFNGQEETISEIKTGDMFEQNYNDVDIIITNPPFSKIVKYIEFLWGLDKKFILVGPITVGLRPKIFELFKIQKIDISNNEIKNFNTLEGVKEVRGIWYYNYKKEIEEEEEIKYYNNQNLIYIKKLKDIEKYFRTDKLLAVPITFLIHKKKYNFELVDLTEFYRKTLASEHKNLIKKRSNTILTEKYLPPIIEFNQEPEQDRIYWEDKNTGQKYIEAFSRVIVKWRGN